MRLSVFLLLANLRYYCRNMSDTFVYQKNSASACFITVPNMELAKKLAHGIVSNNLAACVNIIPGLTSVYSWENKIQEDNELLLMVKTKSNRVDDLSKFIRENHEYEVAEVISTPIENGNAPYLKWIHDTVPDPKENKNK